VNGREIHAADGSLQVVMLVTWWSIVVRVLNNSVSEGGGVKLVFLAVSDCNSFLQKGTGW